jgi:hypothetical protein
MKYRLIAAALAGAAIVANGSAAQALTAEAAPKSAQAALIPTEVLAKAPLISGPSLSPDGTRVLARIGVPGKSQLGLIHVPAGTFLKEHNPAD